ncbi:choice-of-anchor J domain-containing protein [Conexibacter stalactiti]|nr:choice-of-anchor J domain-containing protein [Conexibacter stalactiti]
MSRFTSAVAACALLAAVALAPGVARGADLSEDFDPVVAPGQQYAPAGWSRANLSSPLGVNGWFQGNPPSNLGPFAAHQGADSAYIAANFHSTTGGPGTISNWLITPQLTLSDGDELSFYTRAAGVPRIYPDRLELRTAPNGSCSPGSTADGVGDFTTLLLTINPTLSTSGYPFTWTQYSVVVRGLSAPVNGCVAFRYHVTNAGTNGANSDYIGIDTFRFSDDVTPPVAPTVDGLAPASPSNVATPRATGTAEADSTVTLYGDASCGGPVLGSGSAADFTADGIELTAAADATTTPYATASDGSLNVSSCSAAGPAYAHDGIAPETTDDLPSGWLPAAPAVTLTATDAGSGVAATYYTVGADPAVPTTSSASYDPAAKPVLGDGERIRYFSVDAAGNAETPRQSAAAQVDVVAPATSDDVTTATLPGAAVTLTATDAGSGVAATYYTVGADPAVPTTSSASYDPAAKPVLGDGERIRYLSVDAAGNAETPRSSQTVVAPPQPQPEPRPQPETPRTPAASLPAAPAVTVTERPRALVRGRAVRIVFLSDPGAAGYECRLDGAGWAPCSPAAYELSGLRAGDHRVEVRAVTADGRRGPATVHAFQVNPYSPGLALAGSSLGAGSDGSVALSLGCSPREGEGRGRCRGSVRLTHVVRALGGRGRRVLTLGRARFDAGAGERPVVRLRLTRAGRRLLANAPRHRIAVRVVVDAVDLAGNRTRVSFARPLGFARG